MGYFRSVQVVGGLISIAALVLIGQRVCASVWLAGAELPLALLPR
jgi:hypothetical protein